MTGPPTLTPAAHDGSCAWGRPNSSWPGSRTPNAAWNTSRATTSAAPSLANEPNERAHGASGRRAVTTNQATTTSRASSSGFVVRSAVAPSSNAHNHHASGWSERRWTQAISPPRPRRRATTPAPPPINARSPIPPTRPTGDPAPPPSVVCTSAAATDAKPDDPVLVGRGSALSPLDEPLDATDGSGPVGSGAAVVAGTAAAVAGSPGGAAVVATVVAVGPVVAVGAQVAAGSALARGGGSSGFALPSACQRQPSTIVAFTRTLAGPTLSYCQPVAAVPRQYDQ